MKMDGLFDHILVDESQDTNHQQWNIVKALTEDFFSGISVTNKNRTIFIVGDEKQSIYSFQGAQADISSEIFSYFKEKLRDNPIKFHKIDLSNSFRSLPTILDVVDATFSQEKERNAITKVSDFQGHKAIRQGIGYFEIWPQIKLKKDEKPKTKEKDYEWKFDLNPRENYFAEEFLAQNIAVKIKNWVESGRVLEGRDRSLKYSDFMILLRRRTNGFDRVLQRFFHQYQIPFGGANKIKFADSLIIQDLLACAKFALSPHDDLNLAAVLKSPIFAISEDELLEICLVRNQHKTTIYQALQQLPKFCKTTEILRDLQKKSQQLNCFEFFHFILSQQNRHNIASRFGSQALEILDKFSLKAFDFCNNFSPDLQKFLDFVEKLNPEISFSDADNNQVLITTVHSAKGLQAPVVILPDCCFNTNQLRSTKEKISWIDGLPIWCAAKEEENNLLRSAREIKKHEAKDEYLRLLYVAMTRAENELYIAGSGSTNDEECWYNLVRKSVADKCRKTEFFDEKNHQLDVDNFEIVNEVLVIGEQELNFKKGLQNQSCHESYKIPAAVILKTNSQNFDTSTSSVRRFAQTAEGEERINQISSSQIKGKLIHKILETFGKNYQSSKKWLAEIAQKIIDREEFLSAKEKTAISDEILKFLTSEHFEKLFSGEIKCEVEIAGNSEVRRIDLLVEKENEVLIIDYKSEETLPDKIPQHYIAQLKTYANLVQKIYPQKKIVTAIFWVKFLQLKIITNNDRNY